MTDVLVIGGGVAGTFAALRLRELGREVTLVQRGAGATGMTSGALDHTPWTDASAGSQEVDPQLHAALVSASVSTAQELAAFAQGRSALTIAGSGLVRSAALPLLGVMNLNALTGAGPLGVLDAGRPDFPAEMLVRELGASPYLSGREVVPVSLPGVWNAVERAMPLGRFCRLLDSERALALRGALEELIRARGLSGVLMGPWLGDEPQAIAQVLAVSVPVGEVLSGPSGPAGTRLAHLLGQALIRAGVRVVKAEVTSLEPGREAGFRADLLAPSPSGGPQSERLSCTAVVLATGSWVGGGVGLGEGVARAPRETLVAPFDGGVGSRGGWDAASDGGRWLNPACGPGIDPSDLPPGIVAAGDVIVKAAQTVLGAATSGRLAAERLQRFTEGRVGCEAAGVGTPGEASQHHLE